MQQKLLLMGAALLGLVVLGPPAPARALVALPPPPGPARAANADTIVVGRIVAIEDQDLETTAAPKSEAKVKYRVALLQVSDVLRGPKEAKTIRVASQIQGAFGAFNPNQPPIRPIPRPGIGSINLQVGMDGLFFLNKHHQENIYVAGNFYSYVSKDTGDFQKQVDLTRKSLKVIEDPVAALKAKDSEEKLLAAAILIQKYRQFQGGVPKLEPIDAEESKLILNALLEANWTQQPSRYDPNNPWALFNQLGITEKDGFVRPKTIRNIQDLYNAAREWLKKNADTYRIQKYVSTGKEGSAPPLPVPPPNVRPVPQPVPVPPVKIQPVPPVQIQPAPPGGIQVPPRQVQPPVQILPVLPAEPPQPVQPER